MQDFCALRAALPEIERPVIVDVFGDIPVKDIIRLAVAADVIGADEAGTDDAAVLQDPDTGVIFALVDDDVDELELGVRADLAVRAEGIVCHAAIAACGCIPERDAAAIAVHMAVFLAALVRAG